MSDGSKLTDEQLEKATQVAYDTNDGSKVRWHDLTGRGDIKDSWRKGIRAAAPYLQLPWPEPTDEDALSFLYSSSLSRTGTEAQRTRQGLMAFVRRRNQSLQLPSPDPRRALITAVLSQYPDRAPEIADKILAALDEAKP